MYQVNLLKFMLGVSLIAGIIGDLQGNESELIEFRSFTESSALPAGSFTELSSATTGIEFINKWPDSFDKELGGSFITAGVAVGDFNNDGLPDIFAARRRDGGCLYQNLGGMKFKDVTSEYGLDLTGFWGTGAVFADVNNDGRLDLTICGLDMPNRVYINLGDRFKDFARELGINYVGPSVVMSYCDYDRDGDLDVYLLTNYSQNDERPAKIEDKFDDQGRPIVSRELGEVIYYVKHPDGHYVQEPAGRFDHLLRNDGDQFTNVSIEARVSERPFQGLSCSWWDYNDDGWPDLYVANDFKGPEHLYHNNGPGKDGKVTFTDVAQHAFPHTTWFSMGCDIADVNNDGRMDLLATDMAGTNHYRDKLSMGQMSGPDGRSWFLNAINPPQYMRNALYINSGSVRFLEAAFMAGLDSTDWTWTTKFGDFDQDGLQDVYYTNGMSRDWFNGDKIARAKQIFEEAGGDRDDLKKSYDYWYSTPKFKTENLIFRNTGDLQFKDVSSEWGFDHLGVSTGSATADLDDDGDLDIIVNGFDEPLKIYRNDIGSANSLKVYLKGRTSNRFGLGGKIQIEYVDQSNESQIQIRYLNSTQGIMSSSENVAHFGIGNCELLDRVIVTWPSGIEQVLEAVKTNQTLVISEPESAGQKTVETRQPLNFRQIRAKLTSVRHQEIPFNDFEHQPLIPNKYTQLGPGISWADIDNDGDYDFFQGGAKNQSATIVEFKDGDWHVTQPPTLASDAKHEDMGGLFFDANGDGALDLYVVSGCGEATASRDEFQDRLYLNDGTGKFNDATTQWLPKIETSGSCVVGSDFDRDGDVDLFVGGRIVPGEYPTAPRSFLLVNEESKLVDQTNDIAPGLADAGMVTSAVWSDVNNDHWVDLLVTYEWGPVRLFLNDQGTLRENTAVAGLSAKSGWYNSISAGDIDNDGDVDFVVGNTGLNTKYYASDKKPELIYYGTFDDSGKKHIVEAKYEGEICYPRRGLGCTSDAMPVVKEKLPTFHEFAISSLEDIYTEASIENALELKVNNLKSVVLINHCNGPDLKFEVIPLPNIAQISPIFGSSLTDFNGDGNLDLFVAQNFYGPQRETGNMDGGLGMLFLGDGTGAFNAVWPIESGISIRGDATAVTTLDLNNDGKCDIFVGTNNGYPVCLLNRFPTPMVTVKLVGPRGNVNSIGSRIQVEFVDGTRQAWDLNSGGSYLSQSPSTVFVAAKPIKQIDVTWSDGTQDVHRNPVARNGQIRIEYNKSK